MANTQQFFFYPPTWDYPPNGPIKLGNVITSVMKPERPLHCAPPLDGGGPCVFSTTKTSVAYTKEKFRGGKFSILTKFLSILGLGVDIGAKVDHGDEDTFSFESLETTQFTPTLPYLQSCVESADVRRFLQVSGYRKPVYVITGLKVATGVQANTLKSRGIGGTLAVDVDATVWTGGAVPISGGPGVGANMETTVGTKWDGGSDFVFAFRVSRVFVGKKTGEVRDDEYQRGAMLGNNENRAMGPELTILKVEEPDAEVEGFGEEELMEGEDPVRCAIPKDGGCGK